MPVQPDAHVLIDPDPTLRVQETTRGDRVRAHTDPETLMEIDALTGARVRIWVGARTHELTDRLESLEDESDIERVLEANAAVLALAGLGLGLTVDRRFLAVPAVVLGFLLQHAALGWCPPLSLLRRLGVRTRQEIDTERWALKAMRGDLDPLLSEHRRLTLR